MRDGDRGRGTGSNGLQENTSTKHRPQTSSAWTVMSGLDELHRRPALELAITEPLQHERAVRAHADGVDQAWYEAAQRVGFERLGSQPCRSIAASIPHGR